MAKVRSVSDKESVLCKTRFLDRVLNHFQPGATVRVCGFCKLPTLAAPIESPVSIIRAFPQSESGEWGTLAPQESRPPQTCAFSPARACSHLHALLRDRNPGVRSHRHYLSANRSIDRGASRLQGLRFIEPCEISRWRKKTSEKGCMSVAIRRLGVCVT